MKTQVKILALSAALAANASAVIVVGDIINIDFGTPNGTASGAAVIGSAGDTWTSFGSIAGFRANSLVNSAGTGISLGQFGAAAGGASAASQFGFGSNALTQDYAFLTSDPNATGTLNDGTTVAAEQRFTIFGGDFATDQFYDIYVYGGGDQAGQGFSLSLIQDGGNFVQLSGSGANPWVEPGSTFVEGENYVVFRGVSPTAISGGGEFDFDFYVPQGQSVSAITGIQIQRVTEPVPEPSSAVLGLVGMAALLRRRR